MADQAWGDDLTEAGRAELLRIAAHVAAVRLRVGSLWADEAATAGDLREVIVRHPVRCSCYTCARVSADGPAGGRWDEGRGTVMWCRHCGRALDDHHLVGATEPGCPVGGTV